MFDLPYIIYRVFEFHHPRVRDNGPVSACTDYNIYPDRELIDYLHCCRKQTTKKSKKKNPRSENY